MSLKDKLEQTKFYQDLIHLLKRYSLPGFKGLKIYDVLSFFLKGLYDGALDTRASSMAFKFFLALFPGIIFLFTLIPFLPISGTEEELFSLLKDILPKQAYDLSISTVQDIILNKHGSVLSLNFIIAIYFATNGVKAMVQEFNNGLNVKHQRNYLSTQLVSFLLVCILTIILFVSIAAIVTSTWFIDYLTSVQYFENIPLYSLLEVSTWIILFGLFYFAISVIYYYGPSRHDKWRFFSPGAALASILTLVTSIAFSYYVNNFAQYNKLYGSIGTLISIMLWLYFNSLVLLIGFELNTSLRSAKNKIESS